jgi:predicted lipid-binding transport protein (Tim44 family)
MLTAGLLALTLVRFGFGRGAGFFPMLILLVVVGGIVWALTRSNHPEQPKG